MSAFRKYFLPGFVFQGVLIAGGYGTGRELVEYFMKYGTRGGILGMFLVTTVLWAVILAVTFEFARVFKTYDYRSLLLRVLGPLWVVFEALYLILMVMVLGVVGSAAGVLLRENFGIPYLLGVGVMLAAIGFLTFKGSGVLEKFLSSWSILIYIVYVLFLVAALMKFGPEIKDQLAAGKILPGWSLGGFKYALYNMGVIPSVLFCLVHIETRKEAILSGFLASLIGILPGFLFFLAVLGSYPAVVSEEAPAFFVLQKLHLPALLVAYLIMLFGTLIQTGTGFIHAFNQRLEAALKARGKKLLRWHRPAVALSLLLISVGVATFGLINLVAKGYGSISWGIFLFYFVPLLTIGFYKIAQKTGVKMRPAGPSGRQVE
jgi:uncharacterized membrane protein YkvI